MTLLNNNKKDLMYKDMSQLKEIAQKPVFSDSQLRNARFCNKLLNIYEESIKFAESGEEEKSYILMMRFVEVSLKIKGLTCFNESDKNYVDLMITNEKLKSSLKLLETLHVSLKARYDEKNNRSLSMTSSSSMTTSKSSDSSVGGETASDVDETNKEKDTPLYNGFITPRELVLLIQNDKVKRSFLIIDTRDEDEYEYSHLDLSIYLSNCNNIISCFNLPHVLIEPVSWKIRENLKSGKPDALKLFNDRQSYDYVVLIDESSSYSTMSQHQAKVEVLRKALRDYETDCKLKNQPVILEGGWLQWVRYYPGCCTSSSTKPPAKKLGTKLNEMNGSGSKLNDYDTINYPNIQNLRLKETKDSTKPLIETKPDTQVNDFAKNQPNSHQNINKNNSSTKLLLEKQTEDSKPIPTVTVNRYIKPSTERHEPEFVSKTNEREAQVEKSDVEYDNNGEEEEGEELEEVELTPIVHNSKPQQTEPKPNATQTTGPSHSRNTNNERMKSTETNSSYQNRIEPIMSRNSPMPTSSKKMQFPSEDLINSVYKPLNLAGKPQQPWVNTSANKFSSPDITFNVHKPQGLTKKTEQPPNDTSASRQPKFDPTSIKDQKIPKPNPPTTPAPVTSTESNITRIKLNDEEKIKKTKTSEFKSSVLKRTISSPNIVDMDEKSELSDNSKVPTFNSVKPIPKANADRQNKPQAMIGSSFSAAVINDLQPVFANVSAGLTGLKNLGNTCFLNSVLHCLSHTRLLAAYILSDTYCKDVKRDNKLGSRGRVIDQFAVIVKALWSGHYKLIDPSQFRYLIGQLDNRFLTDDQQDAHEFLCVLLDLLHEDLNRATRHQIDVARKEKEMESMNDQDAAIESWSLYLNNNNSIIVDLFQGQMRSTVTCLTCGKKSIKFDSFMFLQLEVVKSKSFVTVDDCMRNFLKTETLRDDCRWMCPNCKQMREATKKIDLWKMPTILIINLKRFSHDGRWREKVSKYVDYPALDKKLDITPYLASNAPSKSATTSNSYNLYAISNHIGTAGQGHYTAYCQRTDNHKWFKFNDSVVSSIDTSSLKSADAYILFYSRI